MDSGEGVRAGCMRIRRFQRRVKAHVFMTIGGQQGICPNEQERRLQKLMETRQEEDIKELQTSLRDANKSLHQMEAEYSWWKDTVCVGSEHIQSQINSNYQNRCYSFPK
ncbi:hypothetical protein F2Q69_00060415 [Brassica cretica]|uniref:Uncharacterized protein n=1 Tax=Brassica cretica TaxID=69181 RepID=A0A8S9RJE2_BRACR|nr:hypothetical protein F2Q69_00060415 [Brassica cretica]